MQKWVHIVTVINNRTLDIYIDGKHFNIDEEGDLYGGDDEELEGEVLGNYDEDETQPGMMIGAETGTVTWASKVSPKPTETYFAKFYDISSEVDPEYETNGHLRQEMDNEQNITKTINKHPEFKRGDVLFVGSSYETRQEYGFAIYLPEKKEKYEGGEDGVSEP